MTDAAEMRGPISLVLAAVDVADCAVTKSINKNGFPEDIPMSELSQLAQATIRLRLRQTIGFGPMPLPPSTEPYTEEFQGLQNRCLWRVHLTWDTSKKIPHDE